MPRYAAFLRGVNLGSRRRVSNADLCSAFEGLGFEQVAAFRTSGNVVFAAARAKEAKLVERIEKGLGKSLGFDVSVFLRGGAQLRAIAEAKPFQPRRLKSSKGKLQVALLPRKPAAGLKKKALAEATEDDLLSIVDRELYWLPSGGTMDSGLDRQAIERLVGPWTMRTKGTVAELAAKYFAE